MPKALRQLRMEKGETLEQVADAIKATAGMVSAWERGVSRPWPRFIPRLAKHFALTPEQLIESIDESNRQAASPPTQAAAG